MLCIYILILGFLGYQAQGAALHDPNDVVYFSDRLANFIRKKCVKTADETKTDAALDGLERFIYCWMVTLPDTTLDAEEFHTTCLKNAENLTSHLTTFVGTLTPCLEPQENYLAQFIVDSYGNFNHYFCTSLGLTGSRKINAAKCSKKFHVYPETDPLISCYKDSKILGDDATVDIVTKAELCSDISQIHSCYEETFDRHCPDSPEFKDLRLILLRQALEHCDDNNDVERKIY